MLRVCTEMAHVAQPASARCPVSSTWDISMSPDPMVRSFYSEETAGLRASCYSLPPVSLPSWSRGPEQLLLPLLRSLRLALSLTDQDPGLGFLFSRLLKGISSSLLHRPVLPDLQVSSTALPYVCISQSATCPATLPPPRRGDPLLPSSQLSGGRPVDQVYLTDREGPRCSFTLSGLGSV